MDKPFQGVPLPAEWTGYSQHSRDCLPLPTRLWYGACALPAQ
jgi:hypothetical protein